MRYAELRLKIGVCLLKMRVGWSGWSKVEAKGRKTEGYPETEVEFSRSAYRVYATICMRGCSGRIFFRKMQLKTLFELQ